MSEQSVSKYFSAALQNDVDMKNTACKGLQSWLTLVFKSQVVAVCSINNSPTQLPDTQAGTI